MLPLIMGALGVLFYSFKTPQKIAQRPNVLFIAVDDLKPMLNCYGEGQMHTPNIDRLAKMGTVFMNNYCQQAVCSPSRASLMTGQRPDYTRIWDLQTNVRDMNPDILTIPQYFRQNGYTTAGIGKIYHGSTMGKGNDLLSWSHPYIQKNKYKYASGFNEPTNGHYQNPTTIAAIAAKMKEAQSKNIQGKALADFKDGNRGPAVEAAEVPDDAYDDGVAARMTVEMISNFAKTKESFFMAVGFLKPHLPFVSPKKYWDLYDRNNIKTAPFQSFSKDAPTFAFQSLGELVSHYFDTNSEYYPKQNKLLSEAQQKELIHGYYASISYLDAQVGKLLDALDKNGLTKNTIIVLWGDHGWHLGDHAMWCKHSNFEQATHAPLIVASPTHKGGQKAMGLSEFVDIFPTLTDLAGLELPVGLAGKSLVSVLKNPKTEIKHYVQSQYPRKDKQEDLMGYSIRTKNHRFTAWYKENFRANKIMASAQPVATELYDYQQDPNETQNLSGQAKYQKIVKEHQTLMNEFLTNQKHSR